MYFVYVLKSSVDGRFYKGMTADLESRLRAHNAGKVRSTQFHLLVQFEYHWQYDFSVTNTLCRLLASVALNPLIPG
jgi:predicted GIY-YIG superfamily endonuclease